MSESSKRRPKRWLWLAVLILVPVVVMASWAGTDYFLEQTSGVEFCTSCHSMVPMAQAYLKSKHGGNNGLGIQAQCTECHLPQDSVVDYLLTKAHAGFRDAWVQWSRDLEKIDWQAKRGNRHDFVYDSGCVKCHRGIERSNKPTHPAYFADGINPFTGKEFRCVDCHFSVGHQDLSHWLEKSAKQ